MIYLDNAATTYKKPDAVIDAVSQALRGMGNAGRSSGNASLNAARVVYDTREKLASLFGASSPSRIAFTLNATMALNTAIEGLIDPGDHVITTAMEHNSVLRPLYRKQKEGVELTILPADSEGRIDYELLKKRIRPDTRAIICTHASNLTGNLTDIRAIGKMVQDNATLFIVDASQTAGVFPINMKEMGIDVLCFTGHKGLLGPQGTGGIAVGEGVRIRPLTVGGTGTHTYSHEQPLEMPSALEAGTLNAHGIAGLSAAISYIEEFGMDNIRAEEQRMAFRFYNGVKDIEGVKLYGDFRSLNRAAVIALNIRDYDSGSVGDELMDKYEIQVRSGGHCAPLAHKALGTEEQGAVRFSFSHFNTDEEIDTAIRAVREIAAE